MQESVAASAANAAMQARTSRATAAWPLATRVLFRFTFAYFVLFAMPNVEMMVPGMEWFARLYFGAQYRITPWIGKHLLGITRTISISELSSGDRATDYIAFLCIAVLSLAATVVWSIVDRRARAYPRLDAALRIYVRYALAAEMLMYGVIKLFKGQFFAPSLAELTAPLGDFRPMGLLWAFMGSSKPYTVFSGLCETVGGALLFFRRTALLGALLVATVLLNVVMLNFSYHVTVKLNSLNFLFWALFLCAPDASRLFDFFVRERPTSPRTAAPVVLSPRLALAARAAQALSIGFIVYNSTATALPVIGERGDDRPKHPLYGIYDVTDFVVNGDPTPPVSSDARRWRRMFVEADGHSWVRAMTDDTHELALDTTSRRISLTDGSGRKSEFAYAERAPGKLELEGKIAADAVLVRLTRFDETSLPLLRERFRWVNPRSLE